MVQEDWRRLLEEALHEGRGDHWLSWLHLGVMRYHAREMEGPRQAWEKSLALEPSAWAYRDLAILAGEDGRADESAELWMKACRMAPALLPLAAEACKALIEAGRAGDAMGLVEMFPEHVLSHPRMQILEARAALEVGELDRVERILLSGLELTDLREGEDVLSELWFGLHEKRLAAAEKIPIDDKLRERVRREFPPPPQLDFRMSATAQDRKKVKGDR
jgi:tetratricopeptide (TPR) repeat protein